MPRISSRNEPRMPAPAVRGRLWRLRSGAMFVLAGACLGGSATTATDASSGAAVVSSEPQAFRYLGRTSIWLRGGLTGSASGRLDWTRQEVPGGRDYAIDEPSAAGDLAPDLKVPELARTGAWRLGLRDGRADIATGPVEPFGTLIDELSPQISEIRIQPGQTTRCDLVALSALARPLLRSADGKGGHLSYVLTADTVDTADPELGRLDLVRAEALPFLVDVGLGKVVLGYHSLLLVRESGSEAVVLGVSAFGLSEPEADADTDDPQVAFEEARRGNVARMQRVLLLEDEDPARRAALARVAPAVQDYMAFMPLEAADGPPSRTAVPEWSALAAYVSEMVEICGLSVAEAGLNPLASTAGPAMGLWNDGLLRAAGGYDAALQDLSGMADVPATVAPWSASVESSTAVAIAEVGSAGGVAFAGGATALLTTEAAGAGSALQIPSVPLSTAATLAGGSGGMVSSLEVALVVSEAAKAAIKTALITQAVVGVGAGATGSTGLTASQWAWIGGGAAAVGGIAAVAAGGGGDETAESGGTGGASCDDVLRGSGSDNICNEFSRWSQTGGVLIGVGDGPLSTTVTIDLGQSQTECVNLPASFGYCSLPPSPTEDPLEIANACSGVMISFFTSHNSFLLPGESVNYVVRYGSITFSGVMTPANNEERQCFGPFAVQNTNTVSITLTSASVTTLFQLALGTTVGLP